MTETKELERLKELLDLVNPCWWQTYDPDGKRYVQSEGCRTVCNFYDDGGTPFANADANAEFFVLARHCLPALLSANAGMREALAFYAMQWRRNWDGDADVPGGTRSWMEPYPELLADEGKLAQAALSALPTGEAGDAPAQSEATKRDEMYVAGRFNGMRERDVKGSYIGVTCVENGSAPDEPPQIRTFAIAEGMADDLGRELIAAAGMAPTPSPSERVERLEAALMAGWAASEVAADLLCCHDEDRAAADLAAFNKTASALLSDTGGK